MKSIQYHDVRSQRNGLGAFTFIELLVFISIIAMWVVIWMPALNKAKKVVCRTNIRSLEPFIMSW